MAAPTSPTLASITGEALQKAGHTAVLSAQYTTILARAQSQWMEEIKNDIYIVCRNLKSLQTQGVIMTVIGKANYDLPTDFNAFGGDVIELLYGTVTGTASAGATGSITLEVGSSTVNNYYRGKEIVITGGTGLNQTSRIYSYNGTTLVASVSPSFTTAPANDSTYMIVDNYYRVDRSPILEATGQSAPTALGRPYKFFTKEDSTNGQLVVSPIPDNVYAMRFPYYIDLMELDLTSTLMSTLYKKWRNVFVQGVYAKLLQSKGDDRFDKEMVVYGNLLNSLRIQEENELDYETLQIKLVG